MRFKGQIPGSGNQRILNHLGRDISHKIVPREANVESGLSLLHPARIPTAHHPAVSQGTLCQEKKQTT
jgi:hypothetical protein